VKKISHLNSRTKKMYALAVMQEFVGQQKLAWENVAKEVITRREVLQKKIEKIDMAAAMEAIIDQWHLDRSKLADSL
jgi:hypothetical protein